LPFVNLAALLVRQANMVLDRIFDCAFTGHIAEILLAGPHVSLAAREFKRSVERQPAVV
jgi:hypothetical protein